MRITMRTTGLWAACILVGIGSGWAVGEDRPTVPAPAQPAVAVTPADGAGDAAPTPIPGLTDKLGLDKKKPSELLGEIFESPVAGISFYPPAGSKLVKQTEVDHVVDYVDDDRHWILKVTRARLAQPMPLQSVKIKG